MGSRWEADRRRTRTEREADEKPGTRSRAAGKGGCQAAAKSRVGWSVVGAGISDRTGGQFWSAAHTRQELSSACLHECIPSQVWQVDRAGLLQADRRGRVFRLGLPSGVADTQGR